MDGLTGALVALSIVSAVSISCASLLMALRAHRETDELRRAMARNCQRMGMRIMRLESRCHADG